MTIVHTIERDWHLLSLKSATVSTTEVDVLDSVVKKSASRGWLPSMVSEEPSYIATKSELGFDSSNQNVNGWLPLVKEKLYSIPSVEDIFVSVEDSDVDVWVVIPERNLATLHQIVEVEGDLFDTLVSGENPPFLIDFHIIYRCGRNLQELAPTRVIRLPR